MQRRRNIFDIFPETVDLNQGSDDLSDDHHNSQGVSNWDVGESSSRQNVQVQVTNDDLKLGSNWSQFGTHDSRCKERQYDSSNTQMHDGFGEPLNLPMDVDLNLGYGRNSNNDGVHGFRIINLNNSTSSGMGASSSGISNEHLDQTSRGPISSLTNSSQRSSQQPPLMHVPGIPRNVPFSSSSGFSREIDPEAYFRSISRNNEQNRNFVPLNEMRNLVENPTNWSLATGRSSSSTNGQQRGTVSPPWTLFPTSEPESVVHRGHFRLFPSEDNVPLSGEGRHHQSLIRPAPLMEVAGDEWHAFAPDMEGRHRLASEMRQILNALRRSENSRGEDFVLFDPFINGVADLHDRHRDMRLDVDNMSYEELLALEERIGDVKTGLTEEAILKSMKQRNHISFTAMSTQNLEPCCICREEYDWGDDIGTLDCGHDFHTDCIKQWLTQKNLCPICKMPGLST